MDRRSPRKPASPIELSGVLIIAAVCAGFLMWRLSMRQPDSPERPQAVASETTIAQPTRAGTGLSARVGYNSRLKLFRVENGDAFAWSSCQLSLNAAGISSGYTHALETIEPGITGAALIESAEFIDSEGHRFDAERQQVATLDVACQTPQGPRAYGGRF